MGKLTRIPKNGNFSVEALSIEFVRPYLESFAHPNRLAAQWSPSISMVEKRAAGLHRHFEPATAIAGFATLLAACLPARWVAKDPVGWQEAWETGGAVSLVVMVVAGATWFILSRVRSISETLQTKLALTMCGLLVAVLILGPDGPFRVHRLVVPSVSGTSQWGAVIALGLSTAAWRLAVTGARAFVVHALRITALFLVMATCLWPYDGESRVQAMAHIIRDALSMNIDIRSALTQLTLLGSASIAAWLMAHRAGRIESALPSPWGAGWVLGWVVSVELIVGTRAAASFGADVYAAAGLRSALLTGAIAAVIGFGLEAAWWAHQEPDNPIRERLIMGMWLLIYGGALGGVAASVDWAPKTETAWTRFTPATEGDALFLDLLPKLSGAAYFSSNPRGRFFLKQNLQDLDTYEPFAPRVTREIRRWTHMATDRASKAQLERQARAINEAIRQRQWPYLVELEAHHDRPILTAYEISRFERNTAWVTRRRSWDQSTPLRLGWARHGDRIAVIDRDAMQTFWRSQLAPLFTEQFRVAGWARVYQRKASHLRQEMYRAIQADTHSPLVLDALSRYLACIEPYIDPALRDSLDCTQARELSEPWALQQLTKSVTLHETQHIKDGPHLDVPLELAEAMPHASRRLRKQAAAELSAYLSEIVQSPIPQWSLTHLLALAAQVPDGPESYAARVAFQKLGPHPLTMTSPVLRKRARRAYRGLFQRDPG